MCIFKKLIVIVHSKKSNNNENKNETMKLKYKYCSIPQFLRANF